MAICVRFWWRTEDFANARRNVRNWGADDQRLGLALLLAGRARAFIHSDFERHSHQTPKMSVNIVSGAPIRK